MAAADPKAWSFPGIRVIVMSREMIRAMGGDGDCVIIATREFADKLADECAPAEGARAPAPSDGSKPR